MSSHPFAEGRTAKPAKTVAARAHGTGKKTKTTTPQRGKNNTQRGNTNTQGKHNTQHTYIKKLQVLNGSKCRHRILRTMCYGCSKDPPAVVAARREKITGKCMHGLPRRECCGCSGDPPAVVATRAQGTGKKTKTTTTQVLNGSKCRHRILRTMCYGCSKDPPAVVAARREKITGKCMHGLPRRECCGCSGDPPAVVATRAQGTGKKTKTTPTHREKTTHRGKKQHTTHPHQKTAGSE